MKPITLSICSLIIYSLSPLVCSEGIQDSLPSHDQYRSHLHNIETELDRELEHLSKVAKDLSSPEMTDGSIDTIPSDMEIEDAVESSISGNTIQQRRNGINDRILHHLDSKEVEHLITEELMLSDREFTDILRTKVESNKPKSSIGSGQVRRREQRKK